MPIRLATSADLAELSPLFCAYLDFYQVPRPLAEVERDAERFCAAVTTAAR